METMPLVDDFGGPEDIIASSGFKVALTDEDGVVRQIGEILQELADNPETGTSRS